MKVAEEVVSRADVICVSGEPPAVISALATYAARRKKIACYVVDRRPVEARMLKPFQDLKIENVS
jgi:translation initiation factor 2B subunit (eIF-2B alpha/beta/delta family)